MTMKIKSTSPSSSRTRSALPFTVDDYNRMHSEREASESSHLYETITEVPPAKLKASLRRSSASNDSTASTSENEGSLNSSISSLSMLQQSPIKTQRKRLDRSNSSARILDSMMQHQKRSDSFRIQRSPSSAAALRPSPRSSRRGLHASTMSFRFDMDDNSSSFLMEGSSHGAADGGRDFADLKNASVGTILKELKQHSENPQRVSECLIELNNSAYDSPKNKDRICIKHRHGPQAIVQCMKDHLGKDAVQATACAVIHTICYHAEYRESFIKAGAMEAILWAMKFHIDNVTVQERGCGALVNLAHDNPQVKHDFVNAKAGGAKVVVNLLKRHVGNTHVQRLACGLVRDLAYEEETHEELVVREGVVPALMATMRMHASHGAVQWLGISALGNLAAESEKKSDAAGDEEESSKKSSKKDKKSKKKKKKSKDDKVRQTIAKEGGITLIVEAMKEHVLDAAVQTAGCVALENLAYGLVQDEGSTGSLIRKQGGVSAVIQGMLQHPSDAAVQRAGSCALQCLASSHANVKNKKEIVKSGGITALILACRSDPANEKLQRAGVGALFNLAWENDDYKAKIADAGGFEVIQTAMKMHADLNKRSSNDSDEEPEEIQLTENPHEDAADDDDDDDE